MNINIFVTTEYQSRHLPKDFPLFFDQFDMSWNYNTNNINMQEDLLLYARLSLQVAYY